ncbi:MAG: hypothetical protein ACO1NX_09230 [Chitinophagaceae bacterium]
MFKKTFSTFTRTDLVFIICLTVLIVCKFLLQRHQLFAFNSITEVHPLLMIVYAAACLNLFIFFIRALFSKTKREEWWERQRKKERANEFLLNIWVKSLMASFVICLAGTIAAIVLFGSYYMILLSFVVFTVQRYFQLKIRKA